MLLGRLFHNAADFVSISRLPSITVLFLLITSDVVDADRSVFAGIQCRIEANWRPGANLYFAPPPLKKFLKNDIEMFSIELIVCIIISA